MSIEIRQLNIKSSVLQQAAGAAADQSGGQPHIGSACAGQALDEESRNDILAECKAMVLDLMNRSRER